MNRTNLLFLLLFSTFFRSNAIRLPSSMDTVAVAQNALDKAETDLATAERIATNMENALQSAQDALNQATEEKNVAQESVDEAAANLTKYQSDLVLKILADQALIDTKAAMDRLIQSVANTQSEIDSAIASGASTTQLLADLDQKNINLTEATNTYNVAIERQNELLAATSTSIKSNLDDAAEKAKVEFRLAATIVETKTIELKEAQNALNKAKNTVNIAKKAVEMAQTTLDSANNERAIITGVAAGGGALALGAATVGAGLIGWHLGAKASRQKEKEMVKESLASNNKPLSSLGTLLTDHEFLPSLRLDPKELIDSGLKEVEKELLDKEKENPAIMSQYLQALRSASDEEKTDIANAVVKSPSKFENSIEVARMLYEKFGWSQSLPKNERQLDWSEIAEAVKNAQEGNAELAKKHAANGISGSWVPTAFLKTYNFFSGSKMREIKE